MSSLDLFNINSRSSSWRESARSVAAIFVLVAGQFPIHTFLQKTMSDTRYTSELKVETEGAGKKKNAVIAQVVSFGNVASMVDALWLNLMLSQSLTRDSSGFYGRARSQLYYDLNLITDLDPGFFEAYLYGANLLSVTYKDREGARDLLLKGSSFLKENASDYARVSGQGYREQLWKLHVLLGYVYLFDFNSMKDAAEIFEEAATLPGAPSYLEKLSDRLGRPGGDYEVGLRVLKFLMDGASDQKQKAELEQKRLALFKGQFLYEVNLAFDEFVRTQPSFHPDMILTAQLTPENFKKMNGFWREFVRTTHTPSKDPWGGSLYLAENGRVVSTSKYVPVFGLE